MTTETSTALALLIRSAEIMSAEARKAQESKRQTARYGAKFDRAAAYYRSSCFALQADARDIWDYITAEGNISTDRARQVISAGGLHA